MTRWFDDMTDGEVVALGDHIFSETEIVRFRRAYDPLIFRVDTDTSTSSQHSGGLVASGWHPVVVGHRKMVDALLAEDDMMRKLGQEPGISGPSPGVEAVEILAPVRCGDTVSYFLALRGKRVSRSIAGWGLLFSRIEGVNQRDETVYYADIAGFSKLRAQNASPDAGRQSSEKN